MFLNECYLKLTINGYLFIAFNGTKDNNLFISNLKNIIDTNKFYIDILNNSHLKIKKI